MMVAGYGFGMGGLALGAYYGSTSSMAIGVGVAILSTMGMAAVLGINMILKENY